MSSAEKSNDALSLNSIVPSDNMEKSEQIAPVAAQDDGSAPVVQPRQAPSVRNNDAQPLPSVSQLRRQSPAVQRQLSIYLSHRINSHIIGRRGNYNDAAHEIEALTTGKVEHRVDRGEKNSNEVAVEPAREPSFMERILDRLSFNKKNADQLKKTCRNSFKERNLLPFLVYKCNLVRF
jgi:hypothetical protein